MKKKLLALAVAGAFAAPFAAMADTTIYGVANLSYDSTTTSDGTVSAPPAAAVATTSTSQSKISSNSSRIGFKGSEDLGGGTNAIYQIETQVYMDNSTTTGAGTSLGNRNTFVGLNGESWGTVLMGRNDTPYKAATRKLDLFADGIADNRSLMGGVIATTTTAATTYATTLTGAVCALSVVPCAITATAGATTNTNTPNAGVGFDTRPGDVLQYNSPNISGFGASVAYVAGAESPTTGTKGSTWSLAGTYEAGPIFATLAYQTNNIGASGSGTLAGSAATTNLKERAWKLGGSYTMDQLQVNLVYEHTSDDFGTACGGVAGQDCLGHHAWYLGGKFNVSGNDAVKLAYTNVGELNIAGLAGKTNTGAKQISLGYDHSMSKRTTVYALYTKLTNDSAAKYSLSSATGVSTGAAAPSGFGADPSAVSLGIKHTF